MSLEDFFNPKSVAVVGASRQQGKVGYEILTNIIKAGYPGKIFPVNPKTETIEGLKCYPDLLALGHVPDLVIIVIPAKVVPAVMQQCAELGVKTVVIITAGFKEVGKEGKELEQQVSQIAKQAGIRIIGLNCLGLIVPANKLNASFGVNRRKVEAIVERRLRQGVRGQEGVDTDAVAEGLQRLSQLVTEFPQIQEMDINPYVVGPKGTTPIAVDARISVEQDSHAGI